MVSDSAPTPAAHNSAHGVSTQPPRRRSLSAGLGIVGLVCLSYVFGAAVIFFDLPTAGFLGKAFVGARAWNERRNLPAAIGDRELLPTSAGQIDKPGKTCDGYTLYACASLTAPNTQVFLINMRREVVHKWSITFSQVWPRAPHLEGVIQDSLVCIFGCYLYPNGDLLVVFHGLESSTNGFGLAKLDRDSKVLWKYSAKVHHDVDVGEDGTIYALKYDTVDTLPKGLEHIPTPCLLDYLLVLSPDGKERRPPIPILQAFRNSAYAPVLSVLDRPEKMGKRRGTPGVPLDLLHANFVNVLSRKMAPQFPGFKAGQVLVSLRDMETIGVMDVDTASVVWATQGPWRRQHDPQFLPNGNLLIFDNLGSPSGSRVLEYDPRTGAFPWSYPGEGGVQFRTNERGMSQRLANGNTLIVNSEGSQLLEVTPEKEVVWTCSFGAFICTARRYLPEQLTFLKGGTSARP